MARYTGPKARINRRLGVLIYETAGAARALDRRPQPPGMHVRGRRPSNYGLALMETNPFFLEILTKDVLPGRMRVVRTSLSPLCAFRISI